MHLEHRFCRFEALFCGVYIFVLPSSVFSPLSSLFSPQNPQKCRFEPTFTKRRYKEALRAKKPDFMRLFAQTKRPEAVTKLPAFCKMTKRLEISCTSRYRGFESHRLRQRRHGLCIVRGGFFIKKPPLAHDVAPPFPKSFIESNSMLCYDD